VLDAAWALFLKRGVAAVPIEAIAAAAHVSKGTLYACYPDKTALFEAAVRREMERIEAAQGVTRGAPADTPLHETLQAFGMGIMSFLASEPAVGFYNALSAELRLYPNLAKAFWDLGPGQTRANLAAILGAAAKRGEITIDDPFESAEGLFGMWQGFSNLQLALALLPSDRDAWISGRVARGIDLFMRAHARAARETE
jgi:TetR/AcrR family transcriptional repressor of mexJK operon